jgi:hypothetical protein
MQAPPARAGAAQCRPRRSHLFSDGAGRTRLVFAIHPVKVLAFGKGEPFSQTRYRPVPA